MGRVFNVKTYTLQGSCTGAAPAEIKALLALERAEPGELVQAVGITLTHQTAQPSTGKQVFLLFLACRGALERKSLSCRQDLLQSQLL